MTESTRTHSAISNYSGDLVFEFNLMRTTLNWAIQHLADLFALDVIMSAHIADNYTDWIRIKTSRCNEFLVYPVSTTHWFQVNAMNADLVGLTSKAEWQIFFNQNWIVELNPLYPKLPQDLITMKDKREFCDALWCWIKFLPRTDIAITFR